MDENTTQPEVENKAVNETPKNESSQTDEGREADVVKNEEIDYAKELEMAKATLAKKDEIIGHKNRAIQALKKENESEASEIDTDVLAEKVLEKLDSRLAGIELKAQQVAYSQHIASVAGSGEEAKLIQFHLENSIRSSGDIFADVRRAKLLANESKLIKTNKELAEALKAKNTVSNAPAFSGGKAEPETQFSDNDKKILSWAERVTGKKVNI